MRYQRPAEAWRPCPLLPFLFLLEHGTWRCRMMTLGSNAYLWARKDPFLNQRPQPLCAEALFTTHERHQGEFWQFLVDRLC